MAFTLPSLAACQRRKDPERVRAALITAAATLIAQEGLARLTVDAAARMAGVTKGGLFHHFASRQALVEGVTDAMLDLADQRIEALMAADPDPRGAFSRAYLRGIFESDADEDGVSPRAVCRAMLADPELESRWNRWRSERLRRHADTDGGTACAVARLAADGAWLASLADPASPPPVADDVRDAIEALTRAGP